MARTPAVSASVDTRLVGAGGSQQHKVTLLPLTTVDANLQGIDSRPDAPLCWHPRDPVLAVAVGEAVVEYDALSGCRRHLAEAPGVILELRYSHDANSLVALTQERVVVEWSMANWRRRVLVPPHPKASTKPMASGLLAVSSGPSPVVYYSVNGKNSVRVVHTAPPAVPTGAKPAREHVPGTKLRWDNKKPVVGLATHPAERNTLFVLLADGSLLLCSVAGGVLAPGYCLPVPLHAADVARAVPLHAAPHPSQPGGALLLVEALATGATLVDLAPRQEPRIIGTVGFGGGAPLCGIGIAAGGLLVAAGQLPGGNAQLQAWRLLAGSSELLMLPAVATPGTIWDAANASGASTALADTLGKGVALRALVHPPTGRLAVRVSGSPSHHTVLVLQLLDGADPGDGLGAPPCVPLHTGLGFWTGGVDGSGSVVTKLRFPRYAHTISASKLSSYDLTHGLLADLAAPSPVNPATRQQRTLRRVVRSTPQSTWLLFMQVLSRSDDLAAPAPGDWEFSMVPDQEAALSAGQWFMPGCSGAFVGGNHDLVAILANSGRSIAVYETSKLQPGAKPLYLAEFKEGPLAALLPGPPTHIPGPPAPRPAALARKSAAKQAGSGEDSETEDEEQEAAVEAMRQWEEGERRRLDPPKQVLLLTQDNRLCVTDVAQSSGGYVGKARVLAARATLRLLPSETVVQVAWQPLIEYSSGFHTGSEGAGCGAAAAVAVLTTGRVLLATERLRPLASAALPADGGAPVSCLWVGPALLVTTTSNQVLHVCWDGRVVHLASLLGGPPPALLGALADRLLLASRRDPGGRTEVAPRGFCPLQPMVEGWVTLAALRLLPGGAARVRRELRALVCSYDASQLSARVLGSVAAAGFPDIAAAAAARSESSTVTPGHVAVFRAAAGDWDALVALVMQEWEASQYHPKPPPEGSALRARMAAVARACEAYGRFGAARRLLEAAGAWAELLALCTFQGDFLAMQAYAREAGRDVEALGAQLTAVNEDAFRRGPGSGPYSSGPNVEDWTVTLAPPTPPPAGAADAAGGPKAGSEGGEELGSGAWGEAAERAQAAGLVEEEEDSEDLDVAPAGRLPFMEASLQVATGAGGAAPADAEGAPIERLDLSSLEAYLGLPGASVLRATLSTPTAAAAAATAAPMDAGMALTRLDTGFSEISGVPGRGDGMPSARMPGSDSEGEAVEQRPGRGETTAQAAARAAFAHESAADEYDDFFSSDEESAPPDAGESRSLAGGLGGLGGGGGGAAAIPASPSIASASQRFRISIKSQGSDASSLGLGVAAVGDAGALRAAAQSLRLGAPPAPRSVSGLGQRPGSLQIPLPPPSPGGAAVTPSSSTTATGGWAGIGQPPTPDDPFSDMVSSRSLQPSQGSSDPFAALSTTPARSASAASLAPPPPATAAVPSPGPMGPQGGTPMRPQPAPVAPSSDLLSGWDDFEAMFSVPAPASAPGATLAVPSFVLAAPGAAAPAPALAPRGGILVPTVPAAAPQAQQKLADGIKAFQAGSWEKAGKLLGAAADAAPPGGPFSQQALCLYAAACLLQASAQAKGAAAARLARFAAALPLGDVERVPVVGAAIDANVAAKNYGYAAGQLTWLVIQATSDGPPPPGLPSPDALQARLTECDRAGGNDAALPADEDTDAFCAVLSSAGRRAEADDMLEALVRG